VAVAEAPTARTNAAPTAKSVQYSPHGKLK